MRGRADEFVDVTLMRLIVALVGLFALGSAVAASPDDNCLMSRRSGSQERQGQAHRGR
jgi:hypothetical protein